MTSAFDVLDLAAQGEIFTALGEPGVYRAAGTLTDVAVRVVVDTGVEGGPLFDSGVSQRQTVISLKRAELPAGAPGYNDRITVDGAVYRIDDPGLFDDGLEVRVVVVAVPAP